MTAQPPTTSATSTTVPESDIFHNTLPRITIKYCTQCKWLLRAAYFAQELLSTFTTQLGEVALVPETGGVFTVTIYHPVPTSSSQSSSEAQEDKEGKKAEEMEGDVSITSTVLWDRKTNGGFPEVKVLKSLVRNVVDPGRDLGHTDRALKAGAVKDQENQVQKEQNKGEEKEKEKCEECQ